jgi:hypothetical protein
MAWQEAGKRAEARKLIENQKDTLEMTKLSVQAMGASLSAQALLELLEQQLRIMETLLEGFPTRADSVGYVS